MTGLVETVRRLSRTICGTRSIVRTQANSEAFAMMNRIFPPFWRIDYRRWPCLSKSFPVDELTDDDGIDDGNDGGLGGGENAAEDTPIRMTAYPGPRRTPQSSSRYSSSEIYILALIALFLAVEPADGVQQHADDNSAGCRPCKIGNGHCARTPTMTYEMLGGIMTPMGAAQATTAQAKPARNPLDM